MDSKNWEWENKKHPRVETNRYTSFAVELALARSTLAFSFWAASRCAVWKFFSTTEKSFTSRSLSSLNCRCSLGLNAVVDAADRLLISAPVRLAKSLVKCWISWSLARSCSESCGVPSWLTILSIEFPNNNLYQSKRDCNRGRIYHFERSFVHHHLTIGTVVTVWTYRSLVSRSLRTKAHLII